MSRKRRCEWVAWYAEVQVCGGWSGGCVQYECSEQEAVAVGSAQAGALIACEMQVCCGCIEAVGMRTD